MDQNPTEVKGISSTVPRFGGWRTKVITAALVGLAVVLIAVAFLALRKPTPHQGSAGSQVSSLPVRLTPAPSGTLAAFIPAGIPLVEPTGTLLAFDGRAIDVAGNPFSMYAFLSPRSVSDEYSAYRNYFLSRGWNIVSVNRQRGTMEGFQATGHNLAALLLVFKHQTSSFNSYVDLQVYQATTTTP